MFATMQLLLAPLLGRDVLLADLVLTGVAFAATGLVVARSNRGHVSTAPAADVVAEAEAVVAGAPTACPQ